MGESSDPRYDFLQDFTLKSLRLKPDKWVRMMVSDEQRNFITNFVERERPQVGGKTCRNFPSLVKVTQYRKEVVPSAQKSEAEKC